MTDKVVDLHKNYKPDHILENAKGNYDKLIIMGYDSEGLLDVRSNGMTNQQILWMIENFKFKLLHGDYVTE